MSAFFTAPTFVPFASRLVFLGSESFFLSFFKVILEANKDVRNNGSDTVQKDPIHCTAIQKEVKIREENILALN
jgi:hypothetical protein